MRSIVIEREEPTEALGVDGERPDGVHHRLQHRIVGRPASRSAKKRSPRSRSAACPRLDGRRAELVDDVVGVAAEPVERPDVVSLHPRQQRASPSSRWCRAGLVRRATDARTTPRASTGVAAHRCRHRARPVRRPAPPTRSTIGTPTPGTVPEPTNTRPGARRSTLPGRNGPLWRNRWESANGVPRSMPLRFPVERVDAVPRPRCRPGSRGGAARPRDRLGHDGRSAVQSTLPSRFGTGSRT